MRRNETSSHMIHTVRIIDLSQQVCNLLLLYGLESDIAVTTEYVNVRELGGVVAS